MVEDIDTMMDSLVREMDADTRAYVPVEELEWFIQEIRELRHLPAPMVADLLEHVIKVKKVIL